VSEAVVALARMAFGPLRARRLEIRTDSRNTASRAVAERCGFSLEGLLRDDALNVSGQLSDTCIYGMISVNELIDPAR
jgi:RimJ/RimL family protein N-acetyltransferase